MGHHCCVPNCNSSSSRGGGNGLTFHAFPVDPNERKLWILSVRRADYKKLSVNKHTKVCSKHFKKEDFIQQTSSKRRMLKKGVVPSIFSWTEESQEKTRSVKKTESSTVKSGETSAKAHSLPQQSSKRSNNHEAGETLKQILVKPKTLDTVVSKNVTENIEKKVKEKSVKKDSDNNSYTDDVPSSDPLCSSPTKSDDSEQGSVSDITAMNGSSPVSSNNGTPGRKMSALNFQIGTRLEAKDLGNEMWYPVKVVEVDWEDEEVLIHFEKWSQRYDEWVPMDSSRLRPTQNPTPPSDGKSASKVFNVGDRVMAKWSDCKMYPAKVKAVLGNDRYEVLFFDGFTKSIKGFRMTKLEGEIENSEQLRPEEGKKPPPRPISKPVEKNAITEEAIGTKEERRERKRKINVAELFHPKKRMKLESGSASPASSTEIKEKGKKVEKAKRRKESQSQASDEADTEGNSEDTDASKGRKKESSEETSKSTQKPSKDVDKDDADTKWVSDGQNGYIVESADGPRKTTVIPDKNLPPGWSKHTIQRKHGNSAGKWDVLLVNPEGRRFRSRNELRSYFEEKGEPFKSEMFDFCLSGRKRGSRTSEGSIPSGKKGTRGGLKVRVPFGPGGDGLEQRLSNRAQQQPQAVSPQRRVKTLLPKIRPTSAAQSEDVTGEKPMDPPSPPPPYTTTVAPVPAVKIETEMQEGEVLVGGLKIQMENNTYKCPKDSCGKNFRKENLLQMHIKHYHPEYNKFMGSTPNVADLAYARTIGESIDDFMPKSRYSIGSSTTMASAAYSEKSKVEAARKSKTAVPFGVGSSKGAMGGGGDSSPMPEKKKVTAKEKLQSALVAKKLAKGIVGDEGKTSPVDGAGDKKESLEEKTTVTDIRENNSTSYTDTPSAITSREEKKEPQTTIKTLLPVIRSPSHAQDQTSAERLKSKFPAVEEGEEYIEVIDFGPRQTQPTQSTSHVPAPQTPASSSQGPASFTKSLRTIRRRRFSDFHFEPLHKRRKMATKLEPAEDVDVVDVGGSPVDVVSTPTGAGVTNGTVNKSKSTPNYRIGRKKNPVVHLEKLNVTTDSNETIIEQLKKEELINCTCGFMEEDGLMIQCDLCLCWQHGICNNIEKETDVPEKYVCPICLNPYRQRKSKKYMHDQDWLKEGKLPSLSFRSKNEANIEEREAILKRSHDIAGSLLQIQQVLHSLRVKVNIAGKPDHPKLYLWAKSWEKEGDNLTSSQQASGSQSQVSDDAQLDSSVSCGQSEVKTEVTTGMDEVTPKNIVPESDVSLKTIKTECMEADKKSECAEPEVQQEEMEITKKIENNTRQQELENAHLEGQKKETVEQKGSDELSVTESGLPKAETLEKISETGGNLESGNTEENLVEMSEVSGVNKETDVSNKENNETVSVCSANSSNTNNLLNKTVETEGTTVESEDKGSLQESENLVVQTDGVDSKQSESAEKSGKIEEQSVGISENSGEMSAETILNISEHEVQSTVEVSDSNISSVPEVSISEGDSSLVQVQEESANVTADMKEAMETEVTSHSMDNQGLLHQALTNGSHGANPLSNGNLAGQLDAAGHPMLQLPICQSELMQFASTMADNLRVSESSRPAAPAPVPIPEPPRVPQPEAPIDPVECRLMLLDHIDHFQQQLETRLTMIEEQVAALESQDPDVAKDEAPDHFPQTKQTIQMLLRDLLTLQRFSSLN